MSIYRPNPSKLYTLKNDNPKYWALCAERSQYTEVEILKALEDIEQANDEWKALLEKAYSVLAFEDGVEMNPIIGYASNNHRDLSLMLIEANGYISPAMSDNSHTNCFPVKKWVSEIKKTRRDIVKIQKFMELL